MSSSGNSSAIITVESPNRSSICMNRPSGSPIRVPAVAPSACRYQSAARAASRTTICGVIVLRGCSCRFACLRSSRRLCRATRRGRAPSARAWASGGSRYGTWCPTVVVDELAGVAVGEPIGVEVVREAELDPAGRVQACQLVCRQLQLKGGEVVLELLACACAQDRHDRRAWLLGAYPGDRDLRCAGVPLSGDRVDDVDDLEVALGQQPISLAGDRLQARARGTFAAAAVAPGEQPAG